MKLFAKGPRAMCSGCGGLIERDEPRLLDERPGSFSYRHEACERRGTVPLVRELDDIFGRLLE